MFMLVTLGLSAMAGPYDRSPKRPLSDDEQTVPVPAFLQQYKDSLDRLVATCHGDGSDVNARGTSAISPYFYQMITPTTLYQSPLRQIMGLNWNPGTDSVAVYLISSDFVADNELSRLYYSNQALGAMYCTYPTLISITEKDMEESGKVMTNIESPIRSEAKMYEEVHLAELIQDEVGDVAAIVRRPNFWKFSGSNSLNLTQNYATDNWFQGKANHYNLQGIVAIDANFNNQRKITWENRLDLQLGFQTNNETEQNKFKPTNNLLRLNSKLGFKAAKNWYYAFNVKAETQLVPNYQYKKVKEKDDAGVEREYMQRNVITDFLTPLNVDISVGIDWKWNLKRFTGSLYVAPCTYNVKYVDRLELATRYGIDADHRTKSTFGPSATAKFNWKIAENIKWDSRLYWISNLHYTNVEFENTITFSINKYLTSKFYFYPRFNDQNVKNRMPDADGKHTGTYWMFKEWLSLGVSYNW